MATMTDKARLPFRIPHSAFRISSSGQALIESCIVIGLICLLLMGLFQLAQLFMAQEILDYAAGRGARAKAVGFNDFMVTKTVRIGAIANAGRMIFPEPATVGGGPLVQSAVERARIPRYLQSDVRELNFILNYTNWNSITWSCQEAGNQLGFGVHQDVPLMFFSNVFKAFFAASAVPMQGVADIENHCPLYLQ